MINDFTATSLELVFRSRSWQGWGPPKVKGLLSGWWIHVIFQKYHWLNNSEYLKLLGLYIYIYILSGLYITPPLHLGAKRVFLPAVGGDVTGDPHIRTLDPRSRLVLGGWNLAGSRNSIAWDPSDLSHTHNIYIYLFNLILYYIAIF